MIKRFATGLSVVVTAAAFGCSSSSSGGGGAGGGDSIPFSEFDEAFAEAVCTAASRCFGPLFSSFLAGRDCPTLVGKQVAAGEFSRLEAAIAAGRVTYDPNKAPACVAALAARGCDALLDREPAQCQAALDGTVAVGGECTLDAECQGGAYCRSSGTCPGTCTARQPAGGTCSSENDCESGLTCEEDRCVRPAADGDPCGGGVAPDCSPGLLCLGADDEQQRPGECATTQEAFVGEVGAPCAGFLTGSGSLALCKPDLVCALSLNGASLSGACAARYAAGAPCKASFPEGCPTGQYCALPTGGGLSLDGTCRPLPGAGEPCGNGLGDGVCAAYHVCVLPSPTAQQGTCRPVADNGAPCSVDEQCWSERCEDGRCVGDFACQ